MKIAYLNPDFLQSVTRSMCRLGLDSPSSEESAPHMVDLFTYSDLPNQTHYHYTSRVTETVWTSMLERLRCLPQFNAPNQVMGMDEILKGGLIVGTVFTLLLLGAHYLSRQGMSAKDISPVNEQTLQRLLQNLNIHKPASAGTSLMMVLSSEEGIRLLKMWANLQREQREYEGLELALVSSDLRVSDIPIYKIIVYSNDILEQIEDVSLLAFTCANANDSIDLYSSIGQFRELTNQGRIGTGELRIISSFGIVSITRESGNIVLSAKFEDSNNHSAQDILNYNLQLLFKNAQAKDFPADIIYRDEHGITNLIYKS